MADPALLERANEAARQYRTEHGTRISPGQLAVRLRKVNTKQAAELLETIDDTPITEPTTNGRPIRTNR